MSQKLDNMEIGYLYFDAKDYLFIHKKFPELYNLFEQYVDRRSNEIRLAVTDKSCDYLDNKVLLVIIIKFCWSLQKVLLIHLMVIQLMMQLS